MVKVIRNKYIPFKGFKAINICGVIFVRGNRKMYRFDYNHEAIHTKQMQELLVVGFYLIYLLEWLYYLYRTGHRLLAYKRISFEREAYAHQYDEVYKRKHFAMWRKDTQVF